MHSFHSKQSRLELTAFGCCLLFLFGLNAGPLFCLPEAAAQDLSEREADARRLIKLAEDFKLKAARYHNGVSKQEKTAGKLSASAEKLNAQSKKLNAHIRHNVRTTNYATALKLYKDHIAEFQSHLRLYNAHLEDYEKQLLEAQASESNLRSSCKEYADHVQKYHIPGVRAPHVCVQMEWENKDMQRVASNFREDQQRSKKAELNLAMQESKLLDAQKERLALERKLLQKASFADLERTQGSMLLKEYQQIEREYRMLESERKSLSGLQNTQQQK